MTVLRTLVDVLAANGLVTAFAFVGLVVWLSYQVSDRITGGRLHGSAIAIVVGLVLAGVAGATTGGSKGIADFPMLVGVGVLGGAMLRDLAIVATAFGVDFQVIRRAGLGAVVSLLVGVWGSFVVGAAVAFAFGYRDAVSLTTIGAGAATYIVGPVTGTAIGASSDVVALSIAAGVVKAILVMTGTPFVAKSIKLDNPHTAMIFGGLMGTTSGVAGGLAATDPRLVPYGAMTATFYTGLGCLLGPSAFYFVMRALFG
ncbi:MAG: malonate transporter subunit MadM [Longimicrobiales bacterium]|nr:malonate transporter subunit MadM [Longimicrobiales bacterium]